VVLNKIVNYYSRQLFQTAQLLIAHLLQLQPSHLQVIYFILHWLWLLFAYDTGGAEHF